MKFRNVSIRALSATLLILAPALSHAHGSGHAGAFEAGFLHAAFSAHHFLFPLSIICLLGAARVTAPRWKAALVCTGSLGMGALALI